MSSTNNPTRVVAIGESGSTQQQIITALGASNQVEFELSDVIVPSENLTLDVRNNNPEIILIDHKVGEESVLDVIDTLGIQFPDAAIVAIIPADDPLIAQQVMLAGARVFLVQPFTQVNLLSTLRRVRDLEHRRSTAFGAGAQALKTDAQELKTIVVYSPRGGSGCSTVAINLAVTLYEQTNQRVLLIDGKLFFGHLGLMLNIRTNNTIADLIPHAANLDGSLIQDVVVKHATGIDVLLSPFDFQVSQGIQPQDLFNVIQALDRYYDLIVVDGGSSLTENVVTIMDLADRVILVSTPDLASIQDTNRFVQISRSLAHSPDKLLFILNRSDMPGGIKTNDIESVLPNQIFAKIPDGGPNVLRSMNRGIPLVIKYPRNPTSRAFPKMVSQLKKYIQNGSGGNLPPDL